MPHVGIHRLASGNGEEGGAENREGDVEILVDQELEGIKRAQRSQHRRGLDNAVDTEGREHDEPAEHHRTKDPADESCALLLHHEQADEDGDSDRHHRRRQ